MKKIISIIVVCLSTISTWAYDVEVDGVYYNLDTEAKEAEVTKGESNYTGSILIPDIIVSDGTTYKVTSIGNYAFFSFSITSVSISNSVKNIGDWAFYNTCLTSVEIPNSVTNIGNEAFYHCKKLTSVTIGNSVMNIGAEAFYECTGLTSVTIPNSVTSIGSKAFKGCSGITSLTVGNSVTSIGKDAFYGCKCLTSITIGKSVTSIGGRALYDCSNLREIHSNNSIPPVCNGSVFYNVKTANCKLYVPIGSKEEYAFASEWCDFVNIIEETVDDPSSDIAKPSISYNDKKLQFGCTTPNVTYSYTIKADDNTINLIDSDGFVDLTATYAITAYAKKDGKISEAATATLVWATATLNSDVTGAKEITVDALPLLISQEDGMVTVSGLADGEVITAYSADGVNIATSKAIGDAALINLSDLKGKVAVLSVGGRSCKIMVK